MPDGPQAVDGSPHNSLDRWGVDPHELWNLQCSGARTSGASKLERDLQFVRETTCGVETPNRVLINTFIE